MDRLVKPDVKEVEISFRSGQKCSAVFRLTNLMHTMTVAVSLSTTNPSVFSFPQPFSILPPLSSATYTLLSQPSDQPPLRSPYDLITVRSAILPTGKAHLEDLRRLFSAPGRHVFRDATIPISFVGPQVVEFLISHHARVPEVNFSPNKAISGCSEFQLAKLLDLAVRSENADLVSALIDAGGDVNHRGSDGRSLLFAAVDSGNLEIVKVLIVAGCEIDSSSDMVFHEAAARNRVDLIQILCKSRSDIDVNSVDSDKRTAIHVAAARGHVEVLKFLLSIGANADLADDGGRTPLHHSSAAGHLAAVETLLEHSNSKYAVDRDGKTPFALAAENGRSELLPLLWLNDALHRASRLDDVSRVKSCLAEGAAVDERDQNGWTPLHRAAFKGRIECARVLLSHGAQVDAVDDAGYTPLHCAVEAGQAAVAMLLIAHGARANAKSLKGAVPLNLDRYKNHPALAAHSLCREKERA